MPFNFQKNNNNTKDASQSKPKNDDKKSKEAKDPFAPVVPPQKVPDKVTLFPEKEALMIERLIRLRRKS